MSKQSELPKNHVQAISRRPSRPAPETLLPDALYSWADIQAFVRVGRTTWLRRVKAKTAPRPITIGTRCTRYLGRDVLAWIAAPEAYRANEHSEN
ncbi:helix-turn-helix transcriptional regulator [Bordetella avium]|uniref:helix-turn-helix transcriptional regulator n=1 Tax=Bordetella avium TaxID=521 RepID=UPI000FDC14A6|nr:hypothetical protein [Bordetella avium]